MEHPPIMTLNSCRSRRTRCAALGNAVVPDCVRRALRYLLAGPTGAKVWTPKPSLKRHWPVHGCCAPDPNGGDLVVRQWRPDLPVITATDRNLVFDPCSYTTTKPRNKLQTAVVLQSPISARRWTTPRHGNVSAANVLTRRTLRDLPSQVRFERGTPDELRRGQISPEFVEYMMGYPIGWTLYPIL